MAQLLIHPQDKIKSEISVPGDKSISHRAVMIGALARGETVVNNFLPSADCLATAECFRKLGIQLEIQNPKSQIPTMKIIISGKGLKGLKQPKGVLDVGNSGTTIRLLSGILAGQPFITHITGDEFIQRRPMGRIANPLRQMGAGIEGKSRDGGGGEKDRGEIYAPLTISGGKLKPIEYELPVASAQVKSAILLAGLFADGETTVIEKIQARDHTERMLSYFGAEIKVNGPLSMVHGLKEFKGAEIDIPGDISSAAFFMVAGAIMPNAECLMPNVGVNPTRTGIIDVLHRMGANISIENERILSEEPRADILVRSSELRAIKLNGEIIPRIIDEIPIIALAATQAEGVTEIRGARELRIKESDRIATVSSELRKLGAKVQELEDGMMIEGPTKLKGAKVKSYGDHRVAMMLAIAGLVAEGETIIEDTDCIETSFPGFGEIIKRNM